MSAGLEQLIEDIVRRVVREELAAANKPAQPGQLVSVADYARSRSIAPSTVRTAIKDGRIRGVKVGRVLRVPIDAELGEPVQAAPAPTAKSIARKLLGGGR